MKGRAVRNGHTDDAITNVVAGKTRKRRHGGRVVLSLDVESDVRDALRSRAKHAGVSMAEYVASMLIEGPAPHRQGIARIAQPLAAVSYRLEQMADARRQDDINALDREVGEACAIVADALRSLKSDHDAEVGRFDRERNEWEGT